MHKLKMVELLVRHAGRMLQRKGEGEKKQEDWRQVEKPGAVLRTVETAQNRKKQKICKGC